VRESDELALSLTADLDRLAGWAGARFHLSFSMRSGTSLSDRDIGNVFTVAQICCGHTYRLVNVALEQSLFDDRVSLRGGRIVADEFLTSPLYDTFVQTAFNGNPMGILFNVPISVDPVATWGLRALLRPIRQLSLMAGVYNGDPTLGDNDKHGVDWTMRGPLFAIGEVGFHLNQEPFATGLPGTYKIGGYYLAGKVSDLHRDVHGGSIALSGLSPQMHSGNGGFYILLDQMVYRDGGAGSRRGLTPFVSLLVAPDSSVNTMPFFANGGLVYRGLFPSRPHDTAAFGVAYGAFSSQLARAQRDARSAGSGAGIQKYEVALELTYIVQATRWLQVQPDLQYIINPGGTGKIPNALVLGFQLALTL
jgi:porin